MKKLMIATTMATFFIVGLSLASAGDRYISVGTGG